jgi:uncharacterized RDD family membrane protein YckC
MMPMQSILNPPVAATQIYARATPRLRALVRDLAVQFTILVCLVVPPTLFTNQRLLRVLAPVCQGATLGQRSMNLRVVRATTFGRVSFPRALLRTIVKAIFGVPAFLAMYFTSRHQAIHDLVAGTVVVPYSTHVTRPEWFDLARDTERGVLPGRPRRLAVIVVHWVLAYALLILPLEFLIRDACKINPRTCSGPEKWSILGSAFVLFCVVIVLAFAGWKGLLIGAQRKPA